MPDLSTLTRFAAVLVLLLAGAAGEARAQATDRIAFNGQALWLSGGNVAWVDFARDIGPGATRLDRFEEAFADVHAHGGNTMRLWLHTTGAVTPEWDGNRVVGPGEGAIEDLRAILDLAWRYEVGLQLCLWSFDMLRISNGTAVTDRAHALLTDPALLQTYIDHALVPMVDSLKGHPAILAWEIFNEPEGMSNEYGWSFNRKVPMAAIQRFVNRTAGAIHRTDPDAQVTNGAWSFHVLWDGTPGKTAPPPAEPDAATLRHAQQALSAKYRHAFTAAETRAFYDRLQAAADRNFYSDAELVAAGGDADGTLDFYNVHYYEWAGTARSPFHHDYAYWGLDKPLVVAEFFMGGGDDPNPDAVYGIPYGDLYATLYDRGYAGALAWQWYNYPVGAEGVVNWPRMLENMETMRQLHPEAVDVHPGFRISFFRAEPPGIEAGGTSTLSWAVTSAAAVTIDGVAVDSVGTTTVSPAETTTYTLAAEGREGERDTVRVTVEVLDPEQVNRAYGRPAVASTEETCCGNDAAAGRAVDGDVRTRWSSEWETDLADEDPDDEWIYVDLGRAYDLHRVVLRWEAAYGRAYSVDVSYDAQVWTTVYTETNGDGGTDSLVFAEPPAGRYVRMHGRDRATQWGYSLWELEVYGLPSSKQPPTVAFTTPFEGEVFNPGTAVTLTVAAADPDGSVQRVVFYANDDSLGAVSAAPYTFTWRDVPDASVLIRPFALTAVVTDDDGISVRSTPYPIFFSGTGYRRYEAETAVRTGDTAVGRTPAASGGAYVDMKDSGSLTFAFTVDAPARYLLTFGYSMAYDVEKTQYLDVNGERFGEVRFTGPPDVWAVRGVEVPLPAGTNTVTISKYWGWMFFDYLGVSAVPVNVAAEAPAAVPGAFALAQNYPNPFNPSTVVAYELPQPVAVRLEVFDVTGRRVAVLVDGLQPAGAHAARFDARDLASGVYLYRLQAGSFVQTKRMVLMR